MAENKGCCVLIMNNCLTQLFEHLYNTGMSNTTALLTHKICQLHDMGRAHPESPTRLATIMNYLQKTGRLDSLDVVEATRCVDDNAFTRAHNKKLWEAIISKAPVTGLAGFDNETQMCPHTLDAIRYAAGGTIDAVDRIITGVNKNAFVAVRPPGHHATREKSMGFCFVNNVAIGAYHALEKHGLTKVAVIDIDVHHGNGTEHIIAGDTRFYMASTFGIGIYPGNGEKPLSDNMTNVGLRPNTTSVAMRQTVLSKIIPALEAFQPQMIMVSAGYDAHEDDPIGNQGWVDSDYYWWFQQLQNVADNYSNGRLVAVLEGGYNPEALARSVGASLDAMQGKPEQV